MAANTPATSSPADHDRSPLLRGLLSIGLAALILLALRWGINFMREDNGPENLLLRIYEGLGLESAATALGQNGLNPLSGKLVLAMVALSIGVAGIWLLFWVANDLLKLLPFSWREGIRPYVFIGPAVILLSMYLVYPAINTGFLSLTEDILNVPETLPEEVAGMEDVAIALVEGAKNVTFEGYLLNVPALEVARLTVNEKPVILIIGRDSVTAVGLQNYGFILTDSAMHIAFRNNVLWLLFGTSFSVGIGLLIATLVDRIKRESLAKSFIFLPLAISFVGASVIWKFVYAWQPAGRPQIGILNAVVTFFGSEPIPWLINPPGNTFALIAIMVWLQTGFAMVVLSAALKGVPTELLEAARIDGATEIQIFFKVMIPSIRGAIITVTTTIFIAILKVFDIVFVMTNGKFETEVIANRMFNEMFVFRNFGHASALAVILLLVVLPIMVVNIRNLRKQGINQ